MLAEHSPDTSTLLVKTYQRVVRGLFSAAGSQVRHVRDEEKGEKASQFIFGAITTPWKRPTSSRRKSTS